MILRVFLFLFLKNHIQLNTRSLQKPSTLLRQSYDFRIEFSTLILYYLFFYI